MKVTTRPGLALWVSLAALMAGCGSSGSTVDSGNPTADTGTDAVVTDTGTLTDTGTMDSGMDVAPIDTGTDIGTMDSGVDVAPIDTGTDVPTDTGPLPCTGSADCASSALGSVCDTTTGACVQCVASADTCPSAQHCDATSETCVAGCRSDEGCASSTDGGVAVPDGGAAAVYCNTTTHACVQCMMDAQCPAGTVCTGDVCVPGCDSDQACPSGQTCCGTACVNTATNSADCGGCGMACSVPNAVPACVGSACTVGSCMAPFADCDGLASNGCETYTLTSANNCGHCGNVCTSVANAVPACTSGRCAYVCNVGYGDCNGFAADGCEVTLTTNVSDCGSCGLACTGAPNAAPACVAGACGYTCNAGNGDCDGIAANGCEATLTTDASNCGACGNVCGTGLICTGGVCGITSCHALHIAVPSLPTGIYTIDPDGAGPLTPLPMYCDMVTNGGGWTLVQRTVINWTMTEMLLTNYATMRNTTLGSATPGGFYRMAGINWPALQSTNEHLMAQTPIRMDNSSCLPMYYKATGGVWSFPTAGPAILTGSISQNVRIFDATTISTTDTGPSEGCVNTDNAVPWTYTSCCTTCPTFLGGYWASTAGAERPMANYLGTTADLNGNLITNVCAGDTSPPQTSSGYYGEASMEYYLR